jgi:lysophospholipase L1-like esterase
MAGCCRRVRLSNRHLRSAARRTLIALLLVAAACFVSPQPRASVVPTILQQEAHPPAAAPLAVVGLGDSVMAGTACSCPGVVAAYAARLRAAAGRSVSALNLGVPGDTTADLVDQLRTDHRTSAAVAAADVVVVTIGANDLLPLQQQRDADGCSARCYGPASQAMGTRLSDALALIRSLRSGPPSTVLVTTYWNVFTDGAVARAAGGQPQLDWSEQVTQAADQAICVAADSHQGRCIDLTRWFDDEAADHTRLLAADGDHPNAAGVDVIANALLAAT